MRDFFIDLLIMIIIGMFTGILMKTFPEYVGYVVGAMLAVAFLTGQKR